MRTGLLVGLYEKLPHLDDKADPDAWSTQAQIALERFRYQAAEHYTEGGLQRLAQFESARTRRAAVLALGMIGSMDSNVLLAGRLQDDDAAVRRYATDAMWAVWYRAGTPVQNEKLKKLMRARDLKRALAGLDALIADAPDFAEAYNQRAIVFFRKGEFARSIADCEQALKRNPYHFGAQAGMAQCYVRLKKPRAALKAFQQALRLNPNLDDVAENIRTLQDVLGEGGKDDRK
jgi:tetratricopeptide (TPR) repeat protein